MVKQSKKGKVVVVLLWSASCPHCQHNMKAWKEFKKMKGGNVETEEVESAQMTPEQQQVASDGVPTMVKMKDGQVESKITGAKETGSEIASGLGLQSGKGRRRKSARRHGTRITRRR